MKFYPKFLLKIGTKLLKYSLPSDQSIKLDHWLKDKLSGAHEYYLVRALYCQDQILDLFGTVNILFNHAGTIIVKPLHESSEEDYDYLMNINVRSAFLVCNEVIPSMLKNKAGNIIITSSIGGEKGFALESLYCMTKGAVLQLARSIAVEYRDQGIRCNAICPGFVKTNHGLREIKELDEQGQNWNENDLHSVQGRICKPEEVASAVLYLASDDSSFVNGTALYVDNAWYAKG